MTRLLLANLPHDCSEREVQQWLESRGFTVKELRVVRDLVSGSTPGFAYVLLSDEGRHTSAQTDLDGKVLRNRRLVAKTVTSGPALFPRRSEP